MIRSLLAVFVALLGGAAFANDTLPAPKAMKAVEAGALTLIDVRRPEEWAESGLPAGAVGATLQDEDFVEQVLAAAGSKDAPVAVICRSGSRSTAAQVKLKNAGFTNVLNVREGMFGRSGVGAGWLARGLPVMSPEEVDAQ